MQKAVCLCLVWSVWRLELGNADQMAVSNVKSYYYLSATYLRVLLLARPLALARRDTA